MTKSTAVPSAPTFTPGELNRVFSGKAYLDWLRHKIVTNAPLTKVEEVHLWLARSRADESAGHLGAAMQAVEYAKALATTHDPSALGHVLVHHAIIEMRLGHYPQAQELATTAITLLDDHPDVVHCHSTLGTCALESNRFERAEYHHLLAAEIARRHNYLLGLATCLHNLAHINLWRGRFTLSLRFASEAHEIQLTTGATPYTYPLHAAQIFQIRNQRAEAVEALRQLADIAITMPLCAGATAISSARLALDTEDFEAAQRDAEEAYSIAVRVGMPVYDVFARTVNSRLQRMLGNPVAAVEWAQDALLYARRVGYGYMEAHALIEEGAAHRENGNVDAAAARWIEAIDIAERLGASHEQAQALLFMACLYHTSAHSDADAFWQRASHLLLEHGYTFLLERERSLAFPLVAEYARRPEADLRQPAEQLLGKLVNVAALPLHVRGLGEFSVRRGAQRIDAKALQRRRAGELLRYLLIQPNMRVGRDVVIEALWPDNSAGTGQDLLHQATSALRRTLEPDLPDKFPSRYLQFDGEQIRLKLPNGSTVDFLEFRHVARTLESPTDARDRADADRADLDSKLATILTKYHGDLFPDDRYADWAEPLRDELRHLYHQALLRRAQRYLQAGKVQVALNDCRTLLSQDPCQEEATLLAMHACVAQGDRPAALRYYHKLEEALERDFQLAPRSDLIHFAANIRRRKRPS